MKHMPVIVGIGTSAGGLEALEKVFTNLKRPCGMAFIVIQHLSPDYKSMMVEILKRYTDLDIQLSTSGQKLEEDTVYLIPPGKMLSVKNATLNVFDFPAKSKLNFPVDHFFQSLAEDQGKNAIGVILSGAGSDGSLGLRAIKSAGGLTIVQDTESASFAGMPQNAISTHMVDVVAPPERIPTVLMQFCQLSSEHSFSLPSQESSAADSLLNSILEVLLQKNELDFRCFKTGTIYRRIEKRMGINQIFRLEDYLELLEKSPTESTVLCHELMIGVTRFYRDRKSFDTLRQKCLMPLLQDSHKQNSIRLWSTGCSTGEETYTLAMLIRDCMEELKIYPDVKIFGTDINVRAIETAAQGTYPRSILADLPKGWGEKYFTANGEGLKVIESVRKMIIFSPHNIINNPPFNNMDLVVCRNLLIYLKPDYQQTILRNFHFSLQTGGYMMLGSSEDPGAMESHFEVVDVSDKIYRCKGTMTPREYARREPYQRPIGSTWQERSSAARTYPKNDLSKSLQEIINQELLPPGFIVDTKGELIHTHGDMRPFMELPQGFMKLDIKRMLHKDVLNHVNSGIYRIKKDNRATLFKNISIRTKDHVSVFHIHIRPLKMPDLSTYCHVAFEKVEENVALKGEETVIVQDVAENEKERIRELEDELRLSNENLQSTIEELETANEELQATNEELMASNEELQSTNEELQSVNEELYTVNSEYQNKIEQLSKLNIEFDELMEYSGLNSVFLDDQGRIKKFTSNLSKLINLVPSDVGRKIRNFSFGEFNQEISAVIKKVMSTDKEVIETLRSDKKVIHLVVRPIKYDGKSGYVLTLFDLTDLIDQA